MLTILQRRLANDPEAELREAAGEQRKITLLRIDKLEASLADDDQQQLRPQPSRYPQ